MSECTACRYYDDYNPLEDHVDDDGANVIVSLCCDSDDGYGHDVASPDWFLEIEAYRADDCDGSCGATMRILIKYCPMCGRELR